MNNLLMQAICILIFLPSHAASHKEWLKERRTQRFIEIRNRPEPKHIELRKELTKAVNAGNFFRVVELCNALPMDCLYQAQPCSNKNMKKRNFVLLEHEQDPITLAQNAGYHSMAAHMKAIKWGREETLRMRKKK